MKKIICLVLIALSFPFFSLAYSQYQARSGFQRDYNSYGYVRSYQSATIRPLTPSVYHSPYDSVYVNGYSRSNGAYVNPYYRTYPDSNTYNNYSSYGNINPYTGARGYRKW